MAHRKAGGSARNLRDSNAQRLGVKKFGGEAVKTGQIILRQRGTKWHPAVGVRRGKDDTLYAAVDGVVKFYKRKAVKFTGSLKLTSYVSVVPAEKK